MVGKLKAHRASRIQQGELPEHKKPFVLAILKINLHFSNLFRS